MLKKTLFTLLLVGIAMIIASRSTSASEGQIELRNTTGSPSNCYALSGLLPDTNYNILVICRNLLYPADPEAPRYVVWATPVTGSGSIRLGELGIGKAFFKTKTAFSSLFVTEERTADPKTPGGNLVMRGTVQNISFLGQPTTPSQDDSGTENPLVTPSPTPVAQQGSIISRIGGGIIVTVIAVFVIILMLILVKPFK